MTKRLPKPSSLPHDYPDWFPRLLFLVVLVFAMGTVIGLALLLSGHYNL